MVGKKRVVVGLAAVVAAAAAGAAIAATSRGSGSVGLTLWHNYGTESNAVATSNLVKAFEQSKQLAKALLRQFCFPSFVRMAPSKPSDCLKFLPLSKRRSDIHTWRKILKEQGKRFSHCRFLGLLDRIRRQWARSALLSLFSRFAPWDANRI